MSQVHLESERVAPFWGRVAVLPSPVDQTQRRSGLVVPIGAVEEDGEAVQRGVVSAVDEGASAVEAWAEYVAVLHPGVVVYYQRKHGRRVLDLDLLDLSDILAYERDG
jgi:hypothetical protein